MRLTKSEKERLFELMDVMTDRCPQLNIDEFINDSDTAIFRRIFKKLRLDLKGY